MCPTADGGLSTLNERSIAVTIWLDYGTPKVHIAAVGEERASWPFSACGIKREKGRPKILPKGIFLRDESICQRCQKIHAVKP